MPIESGPVELFQTQSYVERNVAWRKLCSQGGLFSRPYFSHNAQRQAIGYPFLHAAQCIGNIVSIAYGIYLFGKSILTLQAPLKIWSILLAIGMQALSAIFNACNVLFSLCSLGSRYVATFANGGPVLPTSVSIYDPQFIPFSEFEENSPNIMRRVYYYEERLTSGDICNYDHRDEYFQQEKKYESACEAESFNFNLMHTFI